MTRELIYKWGRHFRVLDTKREIVVGVYDTPAQARHGWGVYESQGCAACGRDYNKQDEKVTDILRGYDEVKREDQMRSIRDYKYDHNEG